MPETPRNSSVSGGVSRCFKIVSRECFPAVLQGVSGDVSRCFSGVSRCFRWCFEVFQMVFQGVSDGVSGCFRWCFEVFQGVSV